MDLRLRGVAAHPRAGDDRSAVGRPTNFALSARRPGVALARGTLLVEQATSTLAVRALRRAPAAVERIVYCGGARAYVAFLEDRSVAAYRDGHGSAAGIELAAVAPQIGESDRACSFASASRGRPFTVFAKTDSPSIHCVSLSESGTSSGSGPLSLHIFKLHADIQGTQENVSGLDKGLTKLRGKVATKPKSRPCPIVAVAAHPNSDFAAAAYENGLLRIWDIAGKQLHGVYDAQLLLRENIIDVGFHPGFPYLVACTSMGRIMSFAIQSRPIAKGAEPQPAAYKLRDRTRRYRAMCIMEGEPPVILLLTVSRRIVVRLVSEQGKVLASTRFPKASRRLQLEVDDSSITGGPLDPEARITLACEPTFGLIAASFDDKSGNVFVYQRSVDGASGVRRAIVGAPVDTGFSRVAGKSFKGPVEVFSDGMFSQNGKLYSFTLRGKEVSELCSLPPSSEVRRIEVARDQYGSLFAALVFLDIDGESDATGIYDVEECPTQYVVATKRGDDESWNVSEASDGATGCFLNASGRHDRVLILSLDGKSVAIRSFSGRRLTSQEKRNPQVVSGNTRGVQKYRVSHSGVSQVFRAPFASWCSVVYEDVGRNRLVVSKNSFRGSSTFGDPDAVDGVGLDDTYEVDEESEMLLSSSERVLDIRWQWLPSGGRGGEQYLAAIMTTDRIYIVRDVFDPVCRFDFASVARSVVTFTLPTMCWVGPSVMVMFGQYLYSVTLDGKADLVAGMSQSDNAACLLAALPDGIVFVRPPKDLSLPVSLTSRPIGMMSVFVRGMLALPSARGKSGSQLIDKLQQILTLHDTSQGSEAVIESLIRSDLSPIAYILVTSASGQHSLSPLKRATFLARIGDLRGALAVSEAEYSRLPSADSFHNGTELFRILQRILNIAMASGEFAVAQRCSELLGRKGTFSAFVESEGGYAAVTALTKYAKRIGNKGMADTLGVLIEKSARSCVATDDSSMPSIEQLRNTRAGIEAFDGSAVMLGTDDKAEIFIAIPPEEDSNGMLGKAQRVTLPALEVRNVIERLETLQCEDVKVLKSDMEPDEFATGDMLSGEALQAGAGGMLDPGLPGAALAPSPSPFAPLQQKSFPEFENLPDLAEELIAPGEVDMRGRAADHATQQQAAVEAMQQRTQEIAMRAREDVQRMAAGVQGSLVLQASDDRAAMQQQVGHRSDGQANRLLQTAFEKMAEGRYASALRDVKRALEMLAREKGGAKSRELVEGFVSPEQVAELVYYRVALQLLIAIESVTQSAQAGTFGGKMAVVQFASALASLPLRPQHRISALMQAVNANMSIDNYGFAAQGLRALSELGVGRGGPERLRAALAAKYSACAARGGVNRVPQLNTRHCCESLRLIVHGVPELRCAFCPAFFSAPALAELRVPLSAPCPCCGIGALHAQQ